MVVNTINELITLLNQVDEDATVLAAIANDSATSTSNGPAPGLVTTRLGSNVKNVQKVIADIENGIITGVRPSIQDDGVTILDNPATLNFVGSALAVTDVSGVATITLVGEVTKVGTPVDSQIPIWTGDGTLEGTTALTFDGTTVSVSSVAGTRFELNETTSNVEFFQQIINPGTPVATFGTSTNHALRLFTNNISRVSITETGSIGIGTNIPPTLLTLQADNPVITTIDIDQPADGRRIDISGSAGNLTIFAMSDAGVPLDVLGTFNRSGTLISADSVVTRALGDERYRQSPVNPQVGTSYVLALTDSDGIVTMDNAGANTVTINPVGTTAYPVGYIVEVIQLGTGATTITAGAGVALNGVTAGSGTITAQYDVIKLRHVASDVWVVDGNIGVIA